MDTHAIWRAVLSDLQLQITEGGYQTFLARTTLVSLTDTQAIIGCSQPMHIGFVEKRYAQAIKQSLQAQIKRDVSLLFTVQSVAPRQKLDGPLFGIKPAPQVSSFTRILSSSRLNPDYTFENFAVSSSNHMAYAAATAVAKNPGTSYNPLLLYGGVGVGKTHLMQAIGSYVLAQKPKAKIMYCTSEEFTNEIIEAIQTKTASSFKRRYRQVDMLLIDDVQFIAGKNTAQEEFFHTFNSIHQTKGQIILTSDRPPDEMVKLEARLRSRFEGGLIIDIGPPDFELRTAIILIKAKHRGIDLPIEAAKLLGQNIENPRKLEGVLIRLLTESQLNKVSITPDLVLRHLGKSSREAAERMSVDPEKAIDVVASYFNIKLSQLKGNKRDGFLAQVRQIVYYILRVELNLSLMSIGELLGGRDHSTILHGVRKITTMVSTNEKVRGDILGIKAKLMG